MDLTCIIERSEGPKEEIQLTCRIDTAEEIEYFNNGGILHKVIRDLV